MELYSYFMYHSTPVEKLTQQMLSDMAEEFRDHNRGAGLTGLLKVHHGKFYQYIEGPSEACDALYERILRDPRHHKLRTILTGSSSNRRFSSWDIEFDEFTRPKPMPIPLASRKRKLPLYLRNCEDILSNLLFSDKLRRQASTLPN